MDSDSPSVFLIGLTGGIASGKTTVCERFAARSIDIVDADLIAREVVAVGSEGLAEIADQLGSSVLREDGALDRRKLRDVGTRPGRGL